MINLREPLQCSSQALQRSRASGWQPHCQQDPRSPPRWSRKAEGGNRKPSPPQSQCDPHCFLLGTCKNLLLFHIVGQDKPCDQLHVLSEEVDELPLALVPPLRPQHHRHLVAVRHYSCWSAIILEFQIALEQGGSRWHYRLLSWTNWRPESLRVMA